MWSCLCYINLFALFFLKNILFLMHKWHVDGAEVMLLYLCYYIYVSIKQKTNVITGLCSSLQIKV